MHPGQEVPPFPYDQDFPGVVTRVRGKRATTRAALVKSPKVAACATLVERNRGGRHDPRPEAGKPCWSGIRFLTERAVIHEMELHPAPFLSQKGAGPFRATWASHDDYLNDLLAFLFHGATYEPQYGEQLQTRAEWLIEEESFAAALDRVTYHEVQALGRMPLFRLPLIMVASALRPGITPDQLGTAVIAILNGCRELSTEPSGRSLRVDFAERAHRARRGGES
jgi:hypothetical protein